MKKKEITKLPKGFFQKERPTITASEALKDVKPLKWSKNVEKGKTKVEIVSIKK